MKRLSLIADALSHVTLGGISFGMFIITIAPVLTFINPIWFGILFAVIGAILIEKLRTSYSNYQEIAIPIIMSTGIALSAIFISLADGFNQEVVGLFIWFYKCRYEKRCTYNCCNCSHCTSVHHLFYKEMFILVFDEEYSKVIGFQNGYS